MVGYGKALGRSPTCMGVGIQDEAVEVVDGVGMDVHRRQSVLRYGRPVASRQENRWKHRPAPVGRGPASMTVVIVPGRPDASTDLQAVSAAGSLVLTWNPSAWDGGLPVTNHLIEVSSDGGMSWEVVGGDVGRGTTATVSDLENGTTYLLRVRAVSGLGSSRATTVQAGPVTILGTPTGVMAVGGEGLLTLSWIRPADGGRAITGVWVELAPADDGCWQSFVAGPLTTSASIGGLVPGREYRVRVSYGNEIGTGLVSGEVRVLVR